MPSDDPRKQEPQKTILTIVGSWGGTDHFKSQSQTDAALFAWGDHSPLFFQEAPTFPNFTTPWDASVAVVFPVVYS